MLERVARDDHTIEVTFRISSDCGAARAAVAGDFNDWSPDATPMTEADGGWAATVALPKGQAYRFRYLLDGSRWENDWQADRYVDNAFGGHDSVLDLTEAAAER